MATIAFIGLGNMGAPMAINLAKAGHQVRAFDLSREAVAKVVAEGGSAATSAQEAVEGAEVVVSMLPASQHVEGLFLGNGSQAGLLQGEPSRRHCARRPHIPKGSWCPAVRCSANR